MAQSRNALVQSPGAMPKKLTDLMWSVDLWSRSKKLTNLFGGSKKLNDLLGVVKILIDLLGSADLLGWLKKDLEQTFV